jgi:hypothetical protein
MPPTDIATAQGSTLTWGSFKFTSMTGWQVQSGAVTLFDRTHMGSTILGTAGTTRIVKRMDAVAVEGETISVTALGPVSFARTDIGDTATLSLSFEDGDLVDDAVLMDFSVEGSVGQLIQTKMTFRML